MVGGIEENIPVSKFKEQEKLKSIYFDFLKDFKEYLVEYIRDSVIELTVAQIPVHSTASKLFTGITRGKARIKNQGSTPCYISTCQEQPGYRIDPNEVVELYINNQVYVTTHSGSTNIGIIRY